MNILRRFKSPWSSPTPPAHPKYYGGQIQTYGHLHTMKTTATKRSKLPKTVQTEPLIGWRSWKLSNDGILSSIVQSDVTWPKRKPISVNDPNWSLDTWPNGIHAFRLRKDFIKSEYVYSVDVVGTVYLWGKVIEHEFGYRAEFAYPQKLFLLREPDPLTVMMLEDNYGVPVEIDEELPKLSRKPDWFPTFSQQPFRISPGQQLAYYTYMTNASLLSLYGGGGLANATPANDPTKPLDP